MRITSIVGVATVLAALAPAVASADGTEEQHASVHRVRHHVAKVHRHQGATACGNKHYGSWEERFGTFLPSGAQPVITDQEVALRYCWAYNGQEPDFAAQLAMAEASLNRAGGFASCSLCVGRSGATACGPRTIGATDKELRTPFVSLYDSRGNLVVAQPLGGTTEASSASVWTSPGSVNTAGSMGSDFAGGRISDGQASGQIGHGALGASVGEHGIGLQLGGLNIGADVDADHADAHDAAVGANLSTCGAMQANVGTCGQASVCGGAALVGSPVAANPVGVAYHQVGTGVPNRMVSSTFDLDNDGIADNLDPDANGDGILDQYQEIGSSTGLQSPSASVTTVPADVDADGIPDLDDVDIGNNGVVDAIEQIG